MKVIVVDNGSATCKVGIAGDEAPKTVFSTVIGQPVEGSDLNSKDSYVGDDAQRLRDKLAIRYPINHGVITNWDDMEKIWNYAFQDKLAIDPKECSMLMTEIVGNAKANREKMTEILFDTFDTPAMFIAHAPVLTLYASGRQSGFVLSSGDGVTSLVPVNTDGFAILNATLNMDLAGRGLTDYMLKLLNGKCSFDVASKIKESLGYIALDFNQELQNATSNSSLERKYELPDGKVITVGKERFQCPEVLFKPSVSGFTAAGIDEGIYNSIMKCKSDLHETLFGNIVLGGGSTLFPGIAERVTKELQARVPNIVCKVIAPPERMISTWIGGSILGALPAFQTMWVTKQDYEEAGASVVQSKCV